MVLPANGPSRRLCHRPLLMLVTHGRVTRQIGCMGSPCGKLCLLLICLRRFSDAWCALQRSSNCHARLALAEHQLGHDFTPYLAALSKPSRCHASREAPKLKGWSVPLHVPEAQKCAVSGNPGPAQLGALGLTRNPVRVGKSSTTELAWCRVQSSGLRMSQRLRQVQARR